MNLFKIIVLLLQFIVFAAYVHRVWQKYGVLDSISASYYEFAKESEWWKPSLFTFFSWGLSVTMILTFAYLLDAGYKEWQAIPFIISAACGFFLGAAPKFKMELEGTVHVVGAIGLIAFALIGLITAYGAWQWAAVYIVLYFALKYVYPRALRISISKWGSVDILARFGDVPNHTWWIEILAFLLVFAGLIWG